jgi:hypothetical protein
MSNETIGKFLLKLYEKTGDNELGYFDKYEIRIDKNRKDKIIIKFILTL